MITTEESKGKEKPQGKKKQKFEVKPKLKGIHKIQLVADPESLFSEYDKVNNFDGFYYYLLYPDDKAIPPETEAVRPKPPVPIPDSPICLVDGKTPPSPRLELISTVNGQYETSVKEAETVNREWIVRNKGNVNLKNLKIQDSLTETIEISNLPINGEKKGVKTEARKFKVPDTEKTLIGLSTVQGFDERENSVGPVSAAVKINVVKPLRGRPVVKIYSPPKQDPIYATMAKKMPVWGLIESQEPLSKITINGKKVEATQEPNGEYRFETQPGDVVLFAIRTHCR